MIMRLLLAIGTVFFLSGQNSFGGNGDVTGLFSTFRLGEKSGEISGAEIHIVPNPKGYSAIIQASEGAPGFPEVVELVINGNTITFTIPGKTASGFSPGKYTGVVTEKGLRLKGPSGLYEDYFLSRKYSYWQ